MVKPRTIERGIAESFPLATRSTESLDVFTVHDGQEGEFAGMSLRRVFVGKEHSDALRNLDGFVRDTETGGIRDPEHHVAMLNLLGIVREVEWNEKIAVKWAEMIAEVSEAGFAKFNTRASGVCRYLADNPGKFFTVFSTFNDAGKSSDRAARIDGFGMFSIQERYDHPEYVGFEPFTHIKDKLQYLPERAVMRGLFTQVSPDSI